MKEGVLRGGAGIVDAGIVDAGGEEDGGESSMVRWFGRRLGSMKECVGWAWECGWVAWRRVLDPGPIMKVEVGKSSGSPMWSQWSWGFWVR